MSAAATAIPWSALVRWPATAIGVVSIISTVLPQVLELARRRIGDRTYAVVHSSGPLLSTLLSLSGHQHMTGLQIAGITAISTAVLISQLARRTKTAA